MIPSLERLEDRLCPTPPKVPVPVVGTYQEKDALPPAIKMDHMAEISTDYDKDKAALDKLTSLGNAAGVTFVTLMFVPLGYYVYDQQNDARVALVAHMAQLQQDYWYLSQQLP